MAEPERIISVVRRPDGIIDVQNEELSLSTLSPDEYKSVVYALRNWVILVMADAVGRD